MQVSSLISPTLPNVPPPTTGVTRTSLYTPTAACPVCFRLRISPASSPSLPAESSSSPADRQFASGCSPPRLAATQLPSATGTWLTPTRTYTVLFARLHARTRSADSLREGRLMLMRRYRPVELGYRRRFGSQRSRAAYGASNSGLICSRSASLSEPTDAFSLSWASSVSKRALARSRLVT